MTHHGRSLLLLEISTACLYTGLVFTACLFFTQKKITKYTEASFRGRRRSAIGHHHEEILGHDIDRLGEIPDEFYIFPSLDFEQRFFDYAQAFF